MKAGDLVAGMGQHVDAVQIGPPDLGHADPPFLWRESDSERFGADQLAQQARWGRLMSDRDVQTTVA